MSMEMTLRVTLISWEQTASTNLFWAEVSAHKDAGGNNPFKELAKFARQLLVLPFSNAEVERTFSQMNLLKTNLRSKMEIGMLNAILMIRSSLRNSKSCCCDYKITEEMLSGIGTASMMMMLTEEMKSLLSVMIYFNKI